MRNNMNKPIRGSINFQKFYQSQGAVLLILLVMCVFVSMFSDSFFTWSNISNILSQSVTIGLTGIGITFVILTGGIDLSVGGQIVFIATCGMMLYTNKSLGMSEFSVVAVMLGLGILCGSVNGLIIVKFRMAPFIATLATNNITKGLALFLSKGKTIFGIPVSYSKVGLGVFLGVPICVWLMLILFILAYIILKRTTFGRKIYAVGSNTKSAWLSGINVNMTIFAAYLINGLMAAFAAYVLTSKLLSCPGTLGDGAELNAIAAVIIGGTSLTGGEGGIVGTLIGALILTVISNALNLLSVSAFLQDVIKGCIILIAIVLDMARKGYMFKKTYD